MDIKKSIELDDKIVDEQSLIKVKDEADIANQSKLESKLEKEHSNSKEIIIKKVEMNTANIPI